MGKGKKLVIGAIVVLAGFSVMVAMAASDVEAPGTPAATKYDGLTDDQIERVKIVRETCDSNAYLYSSGSETLTNKRLEACVEQEQTLIEKYRSETEARYAGLTPEEIESVQQHRLECEEEEANLPEGVYISCPQRELQLIEQYRAN